MFNVFLFILFSLLLSTLVIFVVGVRGQFQMLTALTITGIIKETFVNVNVQL